MSVHRFMDIKITEYTREDGMNAFWHKDRAQHSGWVLRFRESPVRFYHPKNRVWTVAHAIPNNDWSAYYVTESEALSLLQSLERPI